MLSAHDNAPLRSALALPSIDLTGALRRLPSVIQNAGQPLARVALAGPSNTPVGGPLLCFRRSFAENRGSWPARDAEQFAMLLLVVCDDDVGRGA